MAPTAQGIVKEVQFQLLEREDLETQGVRSRRGWGDQAAAPRVPRARWDDARPVPAALAGQAGAFHCIF